MPETILAAMLAAMPALALVACAQTDDEQEESHPLADEDGAGSGRPDPDPAPDGGPRSCTDQGDFDLEEFAADIFPILNGEIDLDDPESESPVTGCTRGPCHAAERGGLTLSAARTPEENLESFACFVDLRRPRRSLVLVCPSGDDRCASAPHPGAVIFDPPGDLNYSRILAYIRASRP